MGWKLLMGKNKRKIRQTGPLSAIFRSRSLLHQLIFCPFSRSVEIEVSLVVDVVGLLAER